MPKQSTRYSVKPGKGHEWLLLDGPTVRAVITLGTKDHLPAGLEAYWAGFIANAMNFAVTRNKSFDAIYPTPA